MQRDIPVSIVPLRRKLQIFASPTAYIYTSHFSSTSRYSSVPMVLGLGAGMGFSTYCCAIQSLLKFCCHMSVLLCIWVYCCVLAQFETDLSEILCSGTALNWWSYTAFAPLLAWVWLGLQRVSLHPHCLSLYTDSTYLTCFPVCQGKATASCSYWESWGYGRQKTHESYDLKEIKNRFSKVPEWYSEPSVLCY